MHLPYFLFAILLLAISAASAKDPDETRTLQELIDSHGFSLQTYSVTTVDGYILTIHRVVTANYSEDYSKTRKPVIVQHGLLGSANDVFINSPFLEPQDNRSKCGDNFGFCLVMTGRYDIWLPNSRGNGYSDGHTGGLSPKNRNYWNFTFDHMAIYDTPAVIAKVKNVTGHQKVGFIGYSQGANIMFALLSLKPEFSEIIQPFICWAPPVYIGHMTSILHRLSFLIRPLQFTGGEFLFSDKRVKALLGPICKFGNPLLPIGGVVCEEALTLMMGQTDNLNRTRLPVYFNFFPKPVSSWDMAHFGQLWKTKDFYRYDYLRTADNQAAYGEDSAPRYPLEDIPEGYKIGIIRGNTDGFVSNEDAETLIKKLRDGNINVTDYKVPSKTWNHLDYVIGMGAGRLVHDKTIELLDQLG